MELEHILVFFGSLDGETDWRPVDRELLPDWIRDPDIIDRMLAGEKAINTADRHPVYYRVVEIDRPRPAGQLEARKQHAAMQSRMTAAGLIMPPVGIIH